MNNDLISRSALLEKCHDWMSTLKLRQMVENAPDVDAGPKWISVKDKLPETESRFLVVRYDGVTKTSFIDILWFDKGTWWNRIFGGEYAVTHWMPLPEPPKGE